MTSQWSEYSAIQEELDTRYGIDPVEEVVFTPGWQRRQLCLSPLAAFVVLDFETTGFSAQLHEVIEIGAVRVSPGEFKTPTFHRLVQPIGRLPSSITKLTGIDADLLSRDGVEAAGAFEELVAFIGDDPVVAYNASFDLAFLNAGCERHGAGTVDAVHSCALALARSTWPRLANHKLSHVAARLGISLPDAHRALGDASRTANVYRAAMVEHFGLHHLTSAESRQRLAAMHDTP